MYFFSCAQCFRPFQDGVYYEFEGRKYCERDFHVLFAPCCNKCGEFVIGRVIKAMAANWHPQCFRCQMCAKELADCGFIRNQVTFSILILYNHLLELLLYRIAPYATSAMPRLKKSGWANTCVISASKLEKNCSQGFRLILFF